MPRRTFDIKDFKYGIISSVDEEDIPSEAASDSLNIDGDVGEGILQGIPTDIELTVNAASIANIKQGELVENGGYYDLIYHDDSADTISAICDFYDTNANVATKKLNLASSLTTGKLSFLQNQKEVHIGIDGVMGKWVGHCGHKQFSRGTVSGDNIRWTISDASNTTPIIIEAVGHSFVNGNIVRIEGVQGNTAANGFWIVASVDHFAGTFALTGSVGNGAYTLGGYAYQHLIIEDLICPRDIGTSAGEFSLSVGAENAATGFFQNGILYSWTLSLIYDGYQETFLGGTYSDTASAEANYYPLTLICDSAYPTAGNTDGLGQLNKRITGVNIYRADSLDGLAANLGIFRKVASIDINDASWTAGAGGTANDMVIIVNDYGTYHTIGATTYPPESVSYQENSGLPSNLSLTTIYYALSTKGNGYLFAGDCYNIPIIGQARRYIIKSKYLRYDTFNYTTDFMVMPEPFTALHFYDGKLWAFSLNKTYRINPEGLYIEDVFDDAGCQGQRAVHSNEYGMFFGGKLGAWMYRGGQFSNISRAIQQSASGGKSWATFLFTTLTDLIVTSDAKKGYILFINERTDTTAKLFAWAYHPLKQRWDAFSFAGYATGANAGILKGKDGEIYLSNSAATYKLMRPTSDTRQLWEWFSQELSFGETRQIKSLTMIKLDTTGTVTLTYGLDGSTPATSGTSEALINTYMKNVRIKLNAASGTNSIDSLEIVYRPLVGSR